ncbi:Protein zwilch like protein [Trachymyrmex zeteki]|uniref:Protein zwilch n=1 Tax=Mycetomoellerius zeteki TaxID=64791 RepID=A0A151XAP0_9HYME|nr:PREDICTED: protein zwilch homolog [Trachymyrmex zeteki]KYQ57370.1 Protein zwilch like protein [Trachymyrmex zeteki]
MDHLNKILQPHVRASKIRLSYVDELFPDLKDNPYIILHKNVPGIRHLSDHEKNEKSFNEYSMRHDVSGSPLEYSFDNCEFDDTVVITRQNWRKEEESYLPLNRMDASNAVNKCLEHLDTDTLPILALCDGKDPKQSKLIGTIVSQDWFTTLEAVSTGTTNLATIRNKCHKVVQEHLKHPFTQEHNIKISVFSALDLFGIKQEMIDWEKTAKSDFEGNINIEMHSSSLDSRPSKITLVAQINAEWKDSLLKELRDQLFLLSQYLSMIDECKKNIGLQNSIIFTSYSEEHDIINEKLHLLLNGDFNFRKSDNSNVKESNHISKENFEIDAKLRERVQNIFLRHDVDFTDLLWEILIKASTYPQMINYIETILKEIIEHKFTPQINDTNLTKFVKCISNLHHQETISHLLVGSIPLELVVDMGFEKLIRDYLYILRGAQFIDLHDIRQKLNNISSGIFNTESYRNKLIMLAQIHICLECMLLIEAHLECPIENLQSLFAYTYKELVSEQSPLQHYSDLRSRIFTFTVPLPNALANELNKMNPSVWRASVSSHSAASMLTTTTYCNKLPIFPTNIYSTDNVDVQEEIVYGISTISSSEKYKKL